MNRRTKLTLMFAPLTLFFAGFALLVGDMRNPSVVQDQCIVAATGQDVQPLKPHGRFIYRQSGNQVNDVGLQCRKMGTILLNDVSLFLTPVKAGQAAEISQKHYQFMPDRWHINVKTGL